MVIPISGTVRRSGTRHQPLAGRAVTCPGLPITMEHPGQGRVRRVLLRVACSAVMQVSWVTAAVACRFGCQLGAGANVELGEDMIEMCLDGGSTDEEAGGDLGVGEALGDERDDLLLGRGEAGPSVMGSISHTARTAGVGRSLAPIEVVPLGDRC